jgi:deoxyribodipyrimidine photo-lyase
MTTLVWFRQDLRLRDNPALHAASKRIGPLIPLYIWSPEDEGDWPPGAASRWWLHHSLQSLDNTLRERGSRLLIARGPAATVLERVAAETSATAVYWNRRYEPAARECTANVERALHNRRIETKSFNSALLVEPQDLLNGNGEPYRVYTPYMRRLLHDLTPPKPLPAPAQLNAPKDWSTGFSLADLQLLPRIPWYTTMQQVWQPGEAGALKRLTAFTRNALASYPEARDQLAVQGTSRLSPHLHHGEIGPRQIWHALGAKGRSPQYLREVVWREFAYHLLYHFPDTTTKPMRPEFARFPWKRNEKLLRTWQRGRTGVPLVDAGMRELWATGIMHNRVRMVVASFLVKNLLQSWQEGARWFWDTLVDADLANNTMNWQWVAGSGADAAPYFRIFNPETQGKRFDPDGAYVRKWVPERAQDPVAQIHSPAPDAIVSLKESRAAALEAYEVMRKGGEISSRRFPAQ